MIGLVGMKIFRCGADKRPQTRRGFHDAVPCGRVPPDWKRIGVPTGSANGIDVVDVDVKHGARGADWFWRHFEGLPKTRMQVTESGGYHILFRHHEGLRGSTSRIADGVDVRADGNYVIWWAREGLPVANADLLAEWPEWLLAAALNGQRKHSPPKHRISVRDGTANAATADCANDAVSGKAECAQETHPSMHQGTNASSTPEWPPVWFVPTRDRTARLRSIQWCVQREQPGRRNGALFWGACRMAELHEIEGRPGWDRAVELLMNAAALSGLLGEDGPAQCRATIQSGFDITHRKLKAEWREYWDELEERIAHNGGPALDANE
jgi:hypothetical protein